MLRLVALSALVAVAVAIPAHPAPAPYAAPAPYHAPAPAHYDESPKPYAFQYGVADSYSGANFNAQETADGKAVSGSYQVRKNFPRNPRSFPDNDPSPFLFSRSTFPTAVSRP